MKKIFSLACCLIFTTIVRAQENSESVANPLTLEASYTSDNVNNLLGGIRTGYSYLGMANFHLEFNTEKARLWKGGAFYINAVNTHGSTPSADMIGDMQVASNIEAGNHSYIQELWFKQTLGNMELTTGLQDLNVEFANSEYGAMYLNSSFGILPIISGNVSAPIFPLTTLGFTAKWNISEKLTWLNALYDGCPTDFSYNPYNIKWEFISGDGLLAISEIQRHIEMGQLTGTYKLGLYTHSHIIEQKLGKQLSDSLNHTILGIYCYADQKIWASGEESIGTFLQAGYSPSTASTNDAYVGVGVNLKGLFSKSNNDELGLAIAHLRFDENYGSETVIEISWKNQIHENIFIQPDIQYIINPSGSNSNIKNCLAGTVRLGLSF